MCNLINTQRERERDREREREIYTQTYTHKRNGDEDGNGDGNKEGIGESGKEAKLCNKLHKSYRPDQAHSFRTRHHLCSQGVALAGTRQLCSQGPVSVPAHRTEGATVSERREGENWVGGEIRNGGGNGDWNGVGVGNGDVEVDEGANGARTRLGV